MNNVQAGFLNASSVGTRWESGVMWSNRLQGVRLEGGGLVVRNSTITSVMGRYLRGYGWTNDIETSVLIDAGDTNSVYQNEPAPNESRINIGLYGNTSESSKVQ